MIHFKPDTSKLVRGDSSFIDSRIADNDTQIDEQEL
jgi:hypothetical protein